MRFMPTERARQRADTRTVVAFFSVIAVVFVVFCLVVGASKLL